jgi:hypothetical protein
VGCCAQRRRRAAAQHVAPRCPEVLEANQCEWRSGGALCAAQRVRCCAGGRGAGAAGCWAQRKRSAAATHVAARWYDGVEARRRAWRCLSALCAAQRVRCACVRVRAGAAGCRALDKRCAAALHVAPRGHEVLKSRPRC